MSMTRAYGESVGSWFESRRGSKSRSTGTDTHGRAGVRVLVDLPELGVAAGSEFLTLEAGQ